MDVATTLIRIVVDGKELRSTCATADHLPVVRGIIEGHDWIVQEIVERPSVLEPEKFEKEVWVTVQEKSDKAALTQDLST